MSTINERFVQAIDALGIKKTQAAKAAKITDASMSTICSGKTTPSTQTITLFCQAFFINQEWIETGNGQMFIPQRGAAEAGEIAAAATRNNPEEARAFFTDLYNGLSEAEILLMYEIFKKHFNI